MDNTLICNDFPDAAADQFADEITLLKPRVDLRKTLIHNADGSITKRDPERHGEYFDVSRVRVTSLDELRAAFETAGNRIFIHGRPKPTTPMRSTRRKSELFDDERHPFVVLDVDDFVATSNDPAIAAQEVRALLPEPFQAARCAFQATAGHAIKPNAARLRLLFWADRPLHLAETKALLAGSRVKLDGCVTNRMQIVYLAAPKIVGGQDHVAQRWGELPGEPAVRVPAGLQADVKTAASRSRAVLSGVVENDPASINRFLSELGKRDAARIEAIGGRRLSFIAAGQDAGDLAIDEGLASAIVVAWHRPDDDALDDLREALEMEKVPEAEKIVARVQTLGESVRSGMEAGEALNDSIVEAKVADGFSSRDTPIGSRWQPNGGLDEGSDFGSVDEADDAGDRALPAREAFEQWKLDRDSTVKTRTLAEALSRGIETTRRAVEQAATMAALLEGVDDAREDEAFIERLVVEAEASPAVEKKAKAFAVRPFDIRDFRTIEPRRFVFATDYVRKFLSATTAPGGRGKSSLVIAEACCMAIGQTFDGRPAKPLRVLIWNGEDPREELELRVAAWLQHNGKSAADLGGRLAIMSGRDTPLKLVEQGSRGPSVRKADAERLVATIRENGFDVLILDPAISLSLCAENDNVAGDMLAKELGRIAGVTDTAVMIVNHTRKPSRDGDGKVTIADSRGASALTDAARAQRVLNLMSKAEGEKWGIPEGSRWRFVRVGGPDAQKANLAPGAGGNWIELQSETIANGRDGYSDSEVGVARAWSPPAELATVQPLLDTARETRERIAGCLARKGFGVWTTLKDVITEVGSTGFADPAHLARQFKGDVMLGEREIETTFGTLRWAARPGCALRVQVTQTAGGGFEAAGNE